MSFKEWYQRNAEEIKYALKSATASALILTAFGGYTYTHKPTQAQRIQTLSAEEQKLQRAIMKYEIMLKHAKRAGDEKIAKELEQRIIDKMDVDIDEGSDIDELDANDEDNVTIDIKIDEDGLMVPEHHPKPSPGKIEP